jgi:hypothetical protein
LGELAEPLPLQVELELRQPRIGPLVSLLELEPLEPMG